MSLTSVLSKLLEHIVCRSVVQHLEENDILTSRNHGFRSGYLCETQLVATMEDFASNFERGQQTDVAILDFSKAFDTVPHSRLLQKIDAYGVRGPLHKWMTSFLCTRNMTVVIDGESSRTSNLRCPTGYRAWPYPIPMSYK